VCQAHPGHGKGDQAMGRCGEESPSHKQGVLTVAPTPPGAWGKREGLKMRAGYRSWRWGTQTPTSSRLHFFKMLTANSSPADIVLLRPQICFANLVKEGGEAVCCLVSNSLRVQRQPNCPLSPKVASGPSLGLEAIGKEGRTWVSTCNPLAFIPCL
jgi:hypothetical protein